MTATGRESAKIFERYVYEVAGQLWSERICLPQILQHSRLHPLRDHLEGVQSYEELFRLMLTKGVIAPDDFSVLCELLLELNRSDLLHPLYENFGRKGRKLSTGERTSTSTSRRSPLLSAVKTGSSSEFRFLLYSIGSNISMENLKTLLFLVRDLLPRSKVENIEEGSELLELLRQRNCIHEQRPEFLYTLLRDIGRDDLRSSVDEYVYGHLKAQQSFPNDPWLAPDKRHWYRKCSEEESGETENTRWFQQSYKYRLALKQLADKLTPSDLDSMKHMCNDIIPKQQLEKVGHTLDLFVALEDHDMLSLNDITFLENLLKEKKHLLRPLYTRLESSQPSSRNNTLTLQFRRPLMADNKYKMMLRKLGVGLGKREIRELKRLQHKRNHDTEGIQTGCELLQHWEEMGFISQQNTDFLQKCLTTIGRKDLIMHICAFRYFLQMQQQHEQEKPHIERTYTHEGMLD